MGVKGKYGKWLLYKDLGCLVLTRVGMAEKRARYSMAGTISL
jgi:hypothetical protein